MMFSNLRSVFLLLWSTAMGLTWRSMFAIRSILAKIMLCGFSNKYSMDLKGYMKSELCTEILNWPIYSCMIGSAKLLI